MLTFTLVMLHIELWDEFISLRWVQYPHCLIILTAGIRSGEEAFIFKETKKTLFFSVILNTYWKVILEYISSFNSNFLVPLAEDSKVQLDFYKRFITRVEITTIWRLQIQNDVTQQYLWLYFCLLIIFYLFIYLVCPTLLLNHKHCQPQ